MRQYHGKFGIQVGSSTFTDIDYADDAVLFTADPAEWEKALLSYETAASTMGLHCTTGRKQRSRMSEPAKLFHQFRRKTSWLNQ